MEEEPSLNNIAYSTHPAILHGNGLSKIDFNSASNYLAKSWSKSEGCKACKEDNLKLEDIPDEKLPRITIAIIVPHGTPFLAEALQKVYFQTYPRKRIDLFIYNSVS